jgi:3-dehydroquinate synthetase
VLERRSRRGRRDTTGPLLQRSPVAATAEAILDARYQDKKVVEGALTFVLARAIGDCFIAKGIEPDDVRAFLQDELRQQQ